MTDWTAIGAFVGLVITALGLRDLLKLYINRHEGCGKTRCLSTIALYSASKGIQQKEEMSPK